MAVDGAGWVSYIAMLRTLKGEKGGAGTLKKTTLLKSRKSPVYHPLL